MSGAAVELIESDFYVLKEDYSRFRLEDGALLKAKIVLKKIIRSPLTTAQGYPAQVSFDSVNAVAAIVPRELKRPPTSDQRIDVMKDIGKELKYEIVDEKWQEYMTHDGFRVLVKPVVVQVVRYDKYNSLGEPIYNVVLQSVTRVEKVETTASGPL